MTARRALTAPILLAAALALTACATPSGGAPATGSTPEPTSAPVVPSPTPATERKATFAQPDECAEILPTATVTTFERRSLELLGGPGGAYGTDYFADPTPEERQGGISCVYGSEVMQTELIVISVAPLSPAVRPEIMADLLEAGLNETQVDDAIVYEKTGDIQTAPSELHVLRGTSWISVITAPGGGDAHAEARELAAEVAGEVYR